MSQSGILSLENLVVEYGARQKTKAVSGVTLALEEGEALGLVGESGCGKSTTGRCAALVQRPSAGVVRLEGREVSSLAERELRRVRTKVQMIFQDPISSLNPRRKVLDIVAEPLAIWRLADRTEQHKRAAEMLEAVGIDPESGSRRPQELSGGQCQRVSIARALMLEPKILVCDEPVSALDVSVQAQVLNLLADLRARYGLSMLFIAHDLAVVKAVSDKVAVMYLGKLCEIAPAADLYQSPAHPYTRALLDSVPEPDPAARRNAPLQGDIPSPRNPPSGCRFRTRCERAQDVCALEEPPMVEWAEGRRVACHFPLEPAVPASVKLGSS